MIDYDLTSLAGIAASGIVTSRVGAVVYPQTSASTVVAVGDNAAVFEDRGDEEGGGLWSFDPYQNQFALPFDFSAGWTQDVGITYTPNAATAPDSTVSADRARDNSAVAYQRVYRSAASVGYLSLWVKDVLGDAPTGVGCLSQDLTPTLYSSLGTGTDWRRVFHRVSASASRFAIFMAGGADLAPVGAVDMWGAQYIIGTQRMFNLPLADGGSSTGACTNTIPGADLDELVVAGVMDFEIECLPSANTRQYQDVSSVRYLFSIETPAGWVSLHCDTVNYILTVNDAVVLTTTTTAGKWPSNLYWREDDGLRARVYITPTTARVRIGANAAVCRDKEVSGMFPLSTPTACYLGSNGTTANSYFNARFTKVKTHTDHASMELPDGEACQGLFFGDSTSGVVFTQVAIATTMANAAQARAGKRIAVIATAADTLAGQKTKFDASQYKTQSPSPAYACFVLPINNIAGSDTVVAMTTAYQALIDDVKGAHPNIKTWVSYVFPADDWASMDDTDRQNWIDVNSCLNGVPAGGGAAVTGIDKLNTIASATMNDFGGIGPMGSNTLKLIYQVESSPDNVHENNAAREIAGEQAVTDLIALGIWYHWWSFGSAIKRYVP